MDKTYTQNCFGKNHMEIIVVERLINLIKTKNNMKPGAILSG